MLRILLLMFEGIQLVSILRKKFKGQKVALNYRDLIILMASNWDLIGQLIKNNPAIKEKFLKLLSKFRSK